MAGGTQNTSMQGAPQMQGMSQQPFGMQGSPPQGAFAQMQQQQGMMGGMPTGPLGGAQQMPMMGGAPLGGAPLGGAPLGGMQGMAGNLASGPQGPLTQSQSQAIGQAMQSGMQGSPPQDAFAQMQQQQGMAGNLASGPQGPMTQSQAQAIAQAGQSGMLGTPGDIPYYAGGQYNQRPPASAPFSGMLQNLASQGMPQQMMPPRPQLDPRQQARADALHNRVQDLKSQYAANPNPALAAKIEKVRNKRRDILGREPLVSGAPNSQQVGSEDARMQAMRNLQTLPARTG